MKNSITLYPRQPKPGIKQLGKLDAAARIRRQVVAASLVNMQHIVDTFAKYPRKTGRICIEEFWNGSNQNPRFPLIRAIAHIYLDIECEFQAAGELELMSETFILFVRN